MHIWAGDLVAVEAKYKKVIKYIIWSIPILILIFILSLHVLGFYFNSSDSKITKIFQNANVVHSVEYLDFEKKKLRYISSGEIDSNLVIFIHGAPGTWDAYERYMLDSTLLDLTKMLSIDRFGYGPSSPGDPVISIQKQAQAVAKLANKYPSKRLLLVGHSYGGPIAAMSAILLQNQRSVETLMIAPLNDPNNEPVKWYAKLSNLKPIYVVLPNFIQSATKEKMTHAEELRLITPMWNKIESPIIHYHGTKDNLAPFQANFDFSNENIPSIHLSQIQEKEGNHLLIWNQFEKVKNVILKSFATPSN